MIKFSTIGQYEKVYAFKDAVLKTDAYNGDFVKINEDGTAEPSADVYTAIMQEEVGDDAYKDKYLIPAGTHVRVLDIEELDKQYPIKELEIYGRQVPADVAVGQKLKSKADGTLENAEGNLEVTEIIGNKAGVVVKYAAAPVI